MAKVQSKKAEEVVDTSQPKVLKGLQLTGVQKTKTVEIVHPSNPKKTVRIAKEDFDPEVHEKVEKEVVRKRKKVVDEGGKEGTKEGNGKSEGESK